MESKLLEEIKKLIKSGLSPKQATILALGGGGIMKPKPKKQTKERKKK